MEISNQDPVFLQCLDLVIKESSGLKLVYLEKVSGKTPYFKSNFCCVIKVNQTWYVENLSKALMFSW